MVSQLSQFLDTTERSFPPNIEEEHRKAKYPKICSEQCPNHQCPYHNTDHYGQACEMQWEPKENKNMPLQSKPNPNEQLLRTIKIAVAKAMKPALDRLEAIEAQDRTPINRSLNGSEIPLNRYRGTNQENINSD